MKNRARMIGSAIVAVTVAGISAQAASIEWDNGASDGVWTNPVNWAGDALPGGDDIAYISTTDTVIYQDGYTNTVDRYIVRGGSTLNITGGYLSGSAVGSSVRDIIGQTSGHSYLNQSGGEYKPQHILRIGAGVAGTVNLSGGTCSVTRGGTSLWGNPNNSLQIGTLGTLNVTNSVLGTRAGTEIQGGGVFHVYGAASQITNGGVGGAGVGSWYQQSNAVLRVGISTNGLSTIVCADASDTAAPSVILNEGSILDVSFVDGAMETNFWAVLDGSAGSFNNLGMVFDAGVDTNDWGYIVSNNVLYVGYGLGWPMGGDITGPPTPGRTIYWTGAGGDSASDNPTNWVLDTAATIPATWGPYDSDIWHIGNGGVTGVEPGTEYVVDYDGTAVNTGHNGLWVGNGGQGTLNMNSGTLSFNALSGSRQDFGYGSAAGKGTLNVNNGTLTLNAARFGINGGEGNLNLNGGTLIISRQYADLSLQVGVNSGSTGTVTVAGGRIYTRGGVQLGASGGAATGIFSVEGSDATAIGIGTQNDATDGRWLQYSGSILKARIDDTETGITPIVIEEMDGIPGTGFDGDVYFYDGALLDLGWMPGVTNYGSFKVMEWEGQLQINELALAAGVDSSIWSVSVTDENSDGTNDTLWAIAYGETANGTPIPWLIENGLTVGDDEIDNDGDGLLTWEEYVAGTIPTDKTSVFKVTSGENLANGDFVVTWPSFDDRWYSVITNLNLVHGTSGVAASGIQGKAGYTSWTSSVPASIDALFIEIGVTGAAPTAP
ncbi:hypothetical protein [Pontiella sp.]|uniref:hypothetical protein n=1 Tax=Pontiella sp. TaxID=2837462 RepID=UPI003562C220